MRFSIIIPAHNGERYIQSAVSSACRQKRRADEVIVVDDASTDETAKIVQSSEWQDRVQYFYFEKAPSFVDAWNRAIARANGDFVSILHQDDLLHLEYLGKIERAILSHQNVRHIYTACDYIDDREKVIWIPPGPYSNRPVLYSGKKYARNYLNGVISNRHIHRCPGVTTSRDLLLNECAYRSEAGLIADDDFFLRVGAFTKVVGISQPLASFRVHPESTTRKVHQFSYQLGHDYLFQVRYHQQNETLLETEDIVKLGKQAVKFINLLMFQSLLYGQNEWTANAFDLRQELDEMLPSFMKQNLPLWARKMWLMTTLRGENRISIVYVRLLYCLTRWRNLFKSSVARK